MNEVDRAAPDEANGWVSRPKTAMAIKLGVFLVPFFVSFVVTLSASKIIPYPAPILLRGGWWILMAVLGIASLIVVDEVARRMLPLAALMQMTLLFPDQAPSRFGVALRSSSTKQLERRVSELLEDGLSNDETEAASQLLELTAALSRHDRLTRGHGERVRAYSALIGQEMGLSADDLSKLQWAGLIHDVGKLAVPVEILQKPGRLTNDEYDIIKTHPEIGAALIEPLRPWLGEWADAVGQHHERIDGKGYPAGLAGKEISLAARIVSVADVYDVITAARSYKEPQSVSFARAELTKNAGTQFDPEVVRAFLAVSLRKVRWSMGPVAWITQFPFIGTAVTAPMAQVATTGAMGLSAAVGTAMVVTPPPEVAPVSLAYQENDFTKVEDGAVSLEDATPGHVDEEDDQNGTSDDPGATKQASPPNQPPSFQQGPNVTAGVDEAYDAAWAQAIAPGPVEEASQTVRFVVVSAEPEAFSTLPSIDNKGVLRFVAAKSGVFPITVILVDDGGTSGGGIDRSAVVTFEIVVSSPVATTTTTTQPPTTTTAAVATTTTTQASNTTSTTSPRTTTTTPSTTTPPPPSGSLLSCSDAQNGAQDLSGAELSACDLSGTDLTGVNFAGANLQGANLRGATLDGANFDGADLSGANLRKAKMSGGSMRGTNLDNAILRKLDLRSVDLSNASLVNVRAKDTEFKLVDLTGANLTDARFQDAELKSSNFSGTDLTSANFREADLKRSFGTPVWSVTPNWDEATCPDGSDADPGCF